MGQIRTTISRSILSKAIECAGRVINNKAMKPILTCLLLKVDRHTLAVCGTDMDVFIQQDIPCYWSGQEELNFAVSAALLLKAVNNLDGDDVTLVVNYTTTDGVIENANVDSLTLECDGDEIELHAFNGSYPGAPAIESTEEVSLSAKVMEAISTATNFTDPNSGRFVLTAVRIAGEDDYILVDSSDGRRAYRAKFDGYFQSTEVLLPPAFCEVAGHLGDCTIRVDANLCEFKSGTTKVVTRLCEGRFPNLSAVMQRNTDNGEWHTFIFERKPMLAAIKRATLCNTGDRRGVSIAINNSSVVLSGVSDEGKGKANVRCSGHGQVTTMLDEDYVMEFLNCDKQDDIEVTVQSSGSPVFFKTAKAEYVVMPMAPEKPKRQEAEESEEEDESEVAV